MRAATVAAVVAAVAALTARTAAVAVGLALGAVVLAFVVLGAMWSRAEGKARHHRPEVVRMAAVLGSAFVALLAVSKAVG